MNEKFSIFLRLSMEFTLRIVLFYYGESGNQLDADMHTNLALISGASG